MTSELRIIFKSHELRKGDMLDYTMYMYFFLSYCVFVSSLPQSNWNCVYQIIKVIFEICAVRGNYSFCLIIGRISDYLHHFLNFRRHLWKKNHPPNCNINNNNKLKKKNRKQTKKRKKLFPVWLYDICETHFFFQTDHNLKYLGFKKNIIKWTFRYVFLMTV